MLRLESIHPSGARKGRLLTAHGEVATPFFMPIASKGAVKTMDADALATLQKAVDAQTAPILLSNTYHIYLKPGLDVVKKSGGLHQFMGWPHVILTDSGGFQIFSLAALRTLSENGVAFRSHIDGSLHHFTPEKSLEIQSILGSDIWMVLDYFPPYPATHQEAERAVHLTSSWAERCKIWFEKYLRLQTKLHSADHQRRNQLFGIIQGSTFPDLRRQSAQEITALGFDGYAIGGLAVGESPAEMLRVIETTIPYLSENKPRYLMGVGLPEQILEAVKRGIDMFDCVIPTRNARHGSLFMQTHERIVAADLSAVFYSKINIGNAAYKDDIGKLNAYCRCGVCQHGYTRAYLRHLYTVQDPLAQRLATIHNIYFYMQLMHEIREAIS